MFIAMNRFRVASDRGADFEKKWKDRESFLTEVPGFREFHLLCGPTDEQGTLYASHTLWDSRAAFDAWTDSDAFKKGHARAGGNEGIVLAHPVFEGFEVVQ